MQPEDRDAQSSALRTQHSALSTRDPVLETRELTLRIGGATIVDGVSFGVPEGLFVSIIGPNGAGKTSLFNLLSGIYRPTRGQVYFQGADITRLPPYRRAGTGLGRAGPLTARVPRAPEL